MVTGSSPRVRGTGVAVENLRRAYRFIPARAGNRTEDRGSPHVTSVHPRACGEQNDSAPRRESRIGSSPRVRGTGPLGLHGPHRRRFIPARAGNRPHESLTNTGYPVHPRACGEQPVVRPLSSTHIGSSPRVRGTGYKHSQADSDHRFIPARAGNSVPSRRRLPRCNGSSPRVRGTGVFGLAAINASRFIPARAGNSRSPMCAV